MSSNLFSRTQFFLSLHIWYFYIIWFFQYFSTAFILRKSPSYHSSSKLSRKANLLFILSKSHSLLIISDSLFLNVCFIQISLRVTLSLHPIHCSNDITQFLKIIDLIFFINISFQFSINYFFVCYPFIDVSLSPQLIIVTLNFILLSSRHSKFLIIVK